MAGPVGAKTVRLVIRILVLSMCSIAFLAKNSTHLPDTSTYYNDMPHNASVQDAVTTAERRHLDVLHEFDLLTGGPAAQALDCPPPLVPFHNVLAPRHEPAANSTNTDRIPRILHVTHKSRCLPRDLALNMEKWRRTLPTYSIFFHDDDSVARLLDQDWIEFPELQRARKCVLLTGAMTADVWRILLLYKYGGVYADSDASPLEGFKEETVRSELSAFFFNDGENHPRPSQWFMAVEPRHSIMELTIFHIIHNLYAMKDMSRPNVAVVTGPYAVKAAWDESLARGQNTAHDNYMDDVLYNVSGGKQVLKTNQRNIIANGRGGRPANPWLKQLVPYNATLNVKRWKRIEMDSGVLHWSQAKRTLWNKRDLKGVSCQMYLKSIDSGGNNPGGRKMADGPQRGGG